ncbi:MAG: TIGR02206 family membrane protein [Phycisphaerales bacterium JB060]
MSPAFASFTPTHYAVAGAGLACIAAFVSIGRACTTAGERRVARAWAVLWLVQQAIMTVYWLLPASFDVGKSFPLHLCDVAGWLGPFALLLAHTRKTRWLRTVLYFWGIGLSSQAFFTPTLEQGPGDPRFWLFWISHTQIVGAGVYDVIVRGYRPDARDFKTALIVSACWMVPIVLLNWATGLNYGYLGQELEGQTILNALPPWPWRILAMAGIVLVLFTLMWVLWPITERLTRRPGATPPPDTA